jgi:peptidoglycan/LPS O-acetylase OafA/YrhL
MLGSPFIPNDEFLPLCLRALSGQFIVATMTLTISRGVRTVETHRTRPRLLGIEGLRGIAAASVLIYHVQGVLSPASASGLFHFVQNFSQGVTLFFVLSGFLLFLPFARALLGLTAPPRLRSYFLGRTLRIMPAYLCVLMLTSLVLKMAWLPRDVDGSPTRFGTMSWFDTLTAGLLVQGYSPRTVRSGLEVAWTLGVEVAFYVLLPFLVWIASRFAGRLSNSVSVALIPAVVLLLAGTGGKLWWAQHSHLAGSGHPNLEWGANWSTVVARSIVMHADLFAYGMIVAVIFALIEASPRYSVMFRPWRLAVLVGAATLGILWLSHIVHGIFTDSVVALACCLVLLALVTGSPRGALARRLESPWLKTLGTLSFSIYLWHLPVLRWLQHNDLVLPNTVGGFLGNAVLVGAITLPLAALTHRFIEAPALRLRGRGSAKASRSLAFGLARQ